MDVVFADFEYRDDGNQIILGCFDSREHGRHSFDFRTDEGRDEFSKFWLLTRESLWCSFYGPAELTSLMVLGYDVSQVRFVDAMYESRMITLTDTDHWSAQAGLLAALKAFGVDTGTSKKLKDEMRDLILSTDDYTEDEWDRIVAYCWEDVDVLPKLMNAVKEFHQFKGDYWTLAEAEHRGKYIVAISISDYLTDGFPIDEVWMDSVFENRQAITDHLAKEVNDEHGHEVYKYTPEKTKRDGTVVPSRYGKSNLTFSMWVNGEIKAGRIDDWKFTESGKYRCTDKEYLKAQAMHYPHLKSIKEANATFNALRLRDLRELVKDGYIRTNTRAFRAVTGRNGCPPKDGYVLGAPKWMRSFIRPHKGMAFIGSDWSQQEIGLAAYLSKDTNLRDVFNQGDVYWALAQRAGAVPMDSLKKDANAAQKEARALYKNLQLGISYGKQVPSLSLDIRGTVVDENGMPRLTVEQSLDKAEELFEWHKSEFSVYWEWAEETIEQAYFDGFYRTSDWTYYVDGKTKSTQLLNLPMQSMGAAMMRLASIGAVDAGLDLVCSQHDALYVAAPEDEAEVHSEVLEEIMLEASQELIEDDWLTLRTDSHIYTNDEPYFDEDGEEMRLKIAGLLEKLSV